MNATAPLHVVRNDKPEMVCRFCKKPLTEETRHPDRRQGRIHRECRNAEQHRFYKRRIAKNGTQSVRENNRAKAARREAAGNTTVTVTVSKACYRHIKREAERRGVTTGEVVEQALDCSRKPGLLARIFG